MEKTTLKIKTELKDSLKEIAVRKRRPMEELTEKAITKYIQEHTKDDRPK